ncbi:MAG TPA: hypothetical protein VL738_30540 [Dactylosporangium sp.]|nr:hypothetical protein [Dactylosporangium sp.]
MSDRLETLVRQAQEARARAAEPDLERIRRALPILARRRARRRRAGYAAVAAAVVAVLTGVAALLGSGPPGDNRPAGRHTASPGPSGSAQDRVVVMPYGLTDPPAGFRERLRTVTESADGPIAARVYTSRSIGAKTQVPADAPRLTLTVRPGATLPDGDEVGGAGPGSASGTYAEDGDARRLAWAPDPEHVIELEAAGMGIDRTALITYSTHVRPAPATFEKPFAFAWAPGVAPRVTYAVGGDDRGTWAASATADASMELEGTLTATLAPFGNPLAGATAVEVRGAPASYAEGEDPNTHDLVQTVVQRWPGSSKDLTVTFRPDGQQLSRAQMVLVAGGVDQLPDISTDWLPL